ncbi:MAG: glucosamine inositolphosphorylceramide transferase family protein [Bryobacteraceae bacterium]
MPGIIGASSGFSRRLLYKQRWFLGIRKRNGEALSTYTDHSNYRLLAAPRDRFYADPFLITYNGANYLFFEDYQYLRGRGIISCMELDDSGRPLWTAEVLRRPYHLSYPFVFQWAQELWMIPETSANGTVELYRCVRFPDQWIFERTLLNSVCCSDSTLLEYNGQWWLFTSIDGPRRYTYDNLSLFYSASPAGDWAAHPLNPIVTDASRARPAGRIFEDGSGLIRPGQDCSNGYGSAICFHRIERLDEHTYREHVLNRISPDWCNGCAGTHTYNCNDDFEVLDGYKLELDLYGKWLSLVGTARSSWMKESLELSIPR